MHLLRGSLKISRLTNCLDEVSTWIMKILTIINTRPSSGWMRERRSSKIWVSGRSSARAAEILPRGKGCQAGDKSGEVELYDDQYLESVLRQVR